MRSKYLAYGNQWIPALRQPFRFVSLPAYFKKVEIRSVVCLRKIDESTPCAQMDPMELLSDFLDPQMISRSDFVP